MSEVQKHQRRKRSNVVRELRKDITKEEAFLTALRRAGLLPYLLLSDIQLNRQRSALPFIQHSLGCRWLRSLAKTQISAKIPSM